MPSRDLGCFRVGSKGPPGRSGHRLRSSYGRRVAIRLGACDISIEIRDIPEARKKILTARLEFPRSLTASECSELRKGTTDVKTVE